MIQDARIKLLSHGASLPSKSEQYVVCWMESSARIQYKHALAAAIHYANDKETPLVGCFFVIP